MKAPQDIIIRPVITEQSMAGIQNKKYTFVVAKAIKELFNVTVVKVNTMHVRGRAKRQGMHQGYTPDWKKAIVTLDAASEGIEFFNNMV